MTCRDDKTCARFGKGIFTARAAPVKPKSPCGMKVHISFTRRSLSATRALLHGEYNFPVAIPTQGKSEEMGHSSEETPRKISSNYTRSDRIYRRSAVGAGLLTLVILALIGVNLLSQARPALSSQGWGFLTQKLWNPQQTPPVFGIAAILFWTVVIAAIALALAVPVSIACALYLTEIAPRNVQKPLRALVDLLAAIPSLIYGMWGLLFLQPHMVPFAMWLSEKLSFIPIFAVSRPAYTSSVLIASVVVALMVIPICTSVIREVFTQTPQGEKEAALAMGATRWEMIRAVVLPFGRGGIIGGSMLGLGRALGETIAVALIISPIFEIRASIVETGGNSVASLIALRFSEADALQRSGLVAAGLALFGLTLVVNTFAAFIVARSRSGAGVDI